MNTVLFGLCMLAIALPASAAPPSNLAAVVVEDDRVEFHFSAPQTEKIVYHSDPPRLLIDWPDTLLIAAANSVEGKGESLKRVRAGQLNTNPDPVVRVVVELEKPVLYGVSWEGNVMYLALGNAVHSQRAFKPSSTRPKIPMRKKARAETAEAPAEPKKAPLPPPSLKAEAVSAEEASAGEAAAQVKITPKAPAKPAAKAAAPVPAKEKAGPAPEYIVQVGSFSDESRAKAVQSAIEGTVQPVVVTKIDAGGKSFYRVTVGPFPDKPAGAAVVTKLADAGHPGAFVKTKK